MSISDLPFRLDIPAAAEAIAPHIRRTPVLRVPDLVGPAAQDVFFKLESLQVTGSFKVRGAANKMLGLGESDQKRGVIAFSTGNHGKAVAYVAGKTGIRAVVCLSEHVPVYRAEAIEKLGAEVALKGGSQDEAEANYQRLAKERGLVPVVPFDDPMIIAGQGTIALEILDVLPDVDVLMIQLSGGGLLAGIAVAAKSINPKIQVMGVSLTQSPAMFESLKAGQPVTVEEKDSIADSLLGGIGIENRYSLPLIEKYVDAHLLVDEEEIKDAMFAVFAEHRLVVEGAGAVGVAALLHRKMDVSGKKVAALLSGSSIDVAQYVRILQSRLSE